MWDWRRVWNILESRLFDQASQPGGRQPAFNLYRDEEPSFDQAGAAARRRQNLGNYLESLPASPEFLLIGEAPGWRGCRFSGVPFTSEAQFTQSEVDLPFTGQVTSLMARDQRPLAEISATVFWRVLRPWWGRFLAWNCVPVHLHQPGAPCSNRRPASGELLTWQAFLIEVITALQPTPILVAIGKSAAYALALSGQPCLSVRHPAHGGKLEFQHAIERIFNA